MKNNRTIGIGLLLTLFMITSTFAVGPTAADETYGTLNVEKQVFDGANWVENIDAIMGDVVRFKITITYYNTSGLPNYNVDSIVVNDTLPDCLAYKATESPFEDPVIHGDNLVWNFGDYTLYDGETISLVFNATVVGYGENVNSVLVTAMEHCIGQPLSDDDTATVTVHAGVNVQKKVWDPDLDAWVEQLPHVHKNELIHFQASITYYGDIVMKCLILHDTLPECCLSYVGNVQINYPHAGFGVPETTVDGNEITWDWTQAAFNLSDGETIVVTYDVNVTHYSGNTVANDVCAWLWGCCPYTVVEDCDNATVVCVPPDTTFTKQVWNGESWVDETSATVGDTLTFRLTLKYYGETYLENVKIVDYFPCSLTYADQATINETNVSEDLQTVWWNLTSIILDNVPFVLEYQASVVNPTGCCDGINTATATVTEQETQEVTVYEDTACILVHENLPPCRPIIKGPATGTANQVLTYSILSDNYQEDTVMYQFDWGGSLGTWSSAKPEGVWSTFTHQFAAAGTYTVRAKAKDSYGLESGWSNNLTVVITASGTPAGKNLTVTSVKGGLMKLTVTFKNNGTQNVEKVNWSLALEGKLFSRKNTDANGTFNLTAGATVEKELSVKIGFGRATLTAKISKTGYGSFEEEYNILVLGPFVRIR